MNTYLRPTAPIATDALLPSDPGVAMRLAQALTESPLMANHHHGLWGYSGRTAEGRELTIQSTGIGGPSAAAVLGELAAHGVRRAIRLGTATALDPTLAGSVVVAGSALARDGTSRAHGAEAQVAADAALTAALSAAIGRPPAIVASADLAVAPASAQAEALRDAGAVAADLESAALLAASRTTGVALAAAVIVCSPQAPAAESLDAALIELGRACAGALAGVEATADVG
jgi:purine-nucleoside phosphorylase